MSDALFFYFLPVAGPVVFGCYPMEVLVELIAALVTIASLCFGFGSLSLKEYVWGYCYTQLTDVEQEQNGIFFYDRRSKFDLKLIFRIFSKTPRE